MKYEVNLRYFKDENGIWGFTHNNTFNHEAPFAAFVSPEGLFHDVFEHYFEGFGYFSGPKANSIYGEMVATAHKYYIFNELGFNMFKHRKYFNADFEGWRVDTQYLVDEALREDYSEYPLTPLKLPYQRPVDNGSFENVIKDYQSIVAEEYGETRKGVVLQEIANAYRLGYRMAERKWPSKGVWEDQPMLKMFHDFVDFWYDLNPDPDFQHLFLEGSEYRLRGVKCKVNTCKATCKIVPYNEVRQEFHRLDLVNYHS